MDGSLYTLALPSFNSASKSSASDSEGNCADALTMTLPATMACIEQDKAPRVTLPEGCRIA
eukprot:1182252-Prorocentrum_minimum.AAC.1